MDPQVEVLRIAAAVKDAVAEIAGPEPLEGERVELGQLRGLLGVDAVLRLVPVVEEVFLFAVAGVMVTSFEGCHLRAGVEFEVFFDSLGGLKESGDVQVAGKLIGEIENIRYVPAHLAEAEDHPLHGAGGIAITVRVEKRYAYMVPVNGEFFISSKGIFGERFLEIGAPRAPETRETIGPEREVTDGDRIRGIDPPKVDRVLRRSYDNMIATKLFMMTMRPRWRKLRAAIDEALRRNPESPRALLTLAYVHAALRDHGAALKAVADGLRFDRGGSYQDYDSAAARHSPDADGAWASYPAPSSSVSFRWWTNAAFAQAIR